MEIWKDVEGYEGLYQVSNEGRIKSIRKDKFLSVNFSGNGYGRVVLYNNGYKAFLVHRLVATAFLPRPEGCTEVNHKDLNKTDNRSENLEWTTASENTKHAFKNRDIYRAKGSKNHMATLTEEDVIKIRELYETGKYRYKDIAEMFNVGYNVVGYIIRKQTWRHI